MQIIPTIYIRGGKAARPAEGSAFYNENPLEMAKMFGAAGAGFIYLIDYDLPPVGHLPNLKIIKEIIETTGIKLYISGNIKSTDVVKQLMGAGAERIILGSLAYQKPDFLKELCADFPGKIGAHIEVRGGKVVITGWSVASRKSATDYAEQFKTAGVSLILYSELQNEGTITPADIKSVLDFARHSPLPIIHSTDIFETKELDMVLGLKSPKILGTIFGKSIYAGIVDIAATITHANEPLPEGSDEPTLIM